MPCCCAVNSGPVIIKIFGEEISEIDAKSSSIMMVGIRKTSVFCWESLEKENGDVSPKKNGNKPTKANHEQLMQIIVGNLNY
ncbi:hypothetical protein MIDIC_250008 [Alphaproteobacteria bacterium]